MFELLLLILFLICYGFYRLCRLTRRQADREKTYWQDQKRFGSPIAYKIYTAVKVFLATVIIAAVTYIFYRTRLRRLPNLYRFNQPQISGNRSRRWYHPAPADSYMFLFVLQNKILK